jgi:quercetin dioxygenase-like cupin family protein
MKTFQALRDVRPHQLRDGITARAVQGERITMAVVDLEPNATLPEHHHENEQLGFVIKGTMEFRIGSEKRVLEAGDTYVIPSHVPHEAAAGPQGATVADAFAPVRADWEKLTRLDPAPPNWP